MTGVLRAIGAALSLVFAQPKYILLAGALAALAILMAVWMPNFGLLADVLSADDVPLTAKLGIALNLIGGIATNFSLFSAAYTIAISVLFGLTIPMIAYLVAQRRVAAAGRGLAIGSGAMATGVVALGCASCGSLILTVLLPTLGVTSALAALPLQGEEFGIVSVAMLFFSLALVSKSIAASSICPMASAVEKQAS